MSGAHDLGEDVGSLGGLDERLRALVVSVDVTADGFLRVSYAVEYAVTQMIDGDAAEETLHPVQPSGRGRRKANVEA